jgi:hypothetical protein
VVGTPTNHQLAQGAGGGFGGPREREHAAGDGAPISIQWVVERRTRSSGPTGACASVRPQAKSSTSYTIGLVLVRTGTTPILAAAASLSLRITTVKSWDAVVHAPLYDRRERLARNCAHRDHACDSRE